MKPTTLHARGIGWDMWVASDVDTPAKVAALIGLPEGDEHAHTTLAMWNGHLFEPIRVLVDELSRPIWRGGNTYQRRATIRVGSRTGRQYAMHTAEEVMLLHYPLDPRVTIQDITDGTEAFANDADDGWLIHKSSKGQMQDMEVAVRGAVMDAFAPQIEALDNTWRMTPDAKPSDWPVGELWEGKDVKLLKWQRLREFRDKAVACAIEEARKRYIGWYEDNPDKSHVHTLAHDCITTTFAAGSYPTISAEIMNAARAFTQHAYELPWVQRARLAAEAKAAREAASGAEDSGASGD